METIKSKRKEFLVSRINSTNYGKVERVCYSLKEAIKIKKEIENIAGFSKTSDTGIFLRII